MEKIHPFEYIGAYKLYTEKRFLLADEMGMFKTAQSIFANSKFRVKNKKLRTLIVCPTSVREHWAKELGKWAYPKGEINIAYADNLYSAINRAHKSDWTIASYPSMSKLESREAKELRDIGFHHVILDEVHNAKNPEALRARAIKKIADQADYLSLLSGTPIPNTIGDLYVLMSLLDPAKYPFDPWQGSVDDNTLMVAKQSFIQLYVEHPQAVKELLHKKMLRREAKDYLNAHFPELRVHRVEVPLKGLHLETYLNLLSQDMDVGRKIMELAKASVDPFLVDNSLPKHSGGKKISLKYEFLDEIVEKEMRKKRGKVLVFSNLKNGIINYLGEEYEKYGVVKITGECSSVNGDREKVRQQFQKDPNTRIMLTTTVMNEGVDLTAATAIVNLTISWTPAEYYQRIKRSHRPGQIIKDLLNVYTPFTTIPGIQPSIEKATLDMNDSKENTVKYLVSGIQLSIEELKSYDEPSKVPNIVRAITSPNKAVLKYFLKWRGAGSELAERRIKRNPEMSRYIAELYSNFNMAKNSANIYIPVIKEIEKTENLETKVDIGCGPGVLGSFLKEPTIGIDISQDMIEIGKKIYPKNNLMQGKMSSLPLEDKSADLAVCSLAYHMTEPKKERAKTLMEMSRILRHEGYVIITLPGNYMDCEDKGKFKQVLGEYGFSIKNYSEKQGQSMIDLWVLQKVRRCSDKIYSLKWNGDPKKIRRKK